MGQFSWIYSDTEKQLLDNYRADTYLLVPKPFQEQYGKAIYESCYDGYGRFGKYDVYDLIAEWNREFLSKDMLRPAPKLEDYGGLNVFELDELKEQGLSDEEIEKKDLEKKQYYYNWAVERYETAIQRLTDYRNGMSDSDMLAKYGQDWKRYIGIDIACYDEQNASLPYPIKITTEELDYDDVDPSNSDPNQGWLDEDDEDWEEDWENEEEDDDEW